MKPKRGHNILEEMRRDGAQMFHDVQVSSMGTPSENVRYVVLSFDRLHFPLQPAEARQLAGLLLEHATAMQAKGRDREHHDALYLVPTSHGVVDLCQDQPNLCEILDAIRQGECSHLAVASRAVLHDEPAAQSAIIEMVQSWGGQVLIADENQQAQ